MSEDSPPPQKGSWKQAILRGVIFIALFIGVSAILANFTDMTGGSRDRGLERRMEGYAKKHEAERIEEIERLRWLQDKSKGRADFNRWIEEQQEQEQEQEKEAPR